MNESQLRAANNDGMDPYWQPSPNPLEQEIVNLRIKVEALEKKLREVPWTEEEINESSEAFEKHWHNEYPGGMTVSDWANDWVPSHCYESGIAWAEKKIRGEK